MSDFKILLIEDDDIMAAIIEDALTAREFQVSTVADGLSAWDLLRSANTGFETILLDRELPGLDGMELLRRLKALPQYDQVPVIMETSTQDAESIREGLEKGAYYYLTKPFQPEVLLAIVHAAVSQYREYRRLQEDLETAERGLLFLDHGHFHIRSPEDARILANTLARICPRPHQAVLGLQALFINAIEHGNLGLGYAEKTRLIFKGQLEQEWQRRLALPQNQAKSVSIRFERLPDALAFTIQDQGEGFAYQQYLDFDPARLFDPNGRGIAMARELSFDTLEYQGNGNTVLATVRQRG